MVRRYLVSGRVQGVGYRRFVHREATRLDLKGRVRNLEDGRVEVYVEGNESVLRELESLLAEGPSFSQVSNVDVQTLNESAFDARVFEVVADGEAPWDL
ncbi:MAG TPA: acylphosphatase [Bdellovibrionales bacterium]|nr:acylphosphatase [Bdellovibrionales bacterium]